MKRNILDKIERFVQFFPLHLAIFLSFFWGPTEVWISRASANKGFFCRASGRIMATYENDRIEPHSLSRFPRAPYGSRMCALSIGLTEWSNAETLYRPQLTENVSNLASPPLSLDAPLNPEKNNHNSPGTQLEFGSGPLGARNLKQSGKKIFGDVRITIEAHQSLLVFPFFSILSYLILAIDFFPSNKQTVNAAIFLEKSKERVNN